VPPVQPAAAPAAAPISYAPSPPLGAQAGGMTDNVASTLCYVFGWVTGLIFLLIPPYNANRTVRFHALQSIFFNIAFFAVWMVLWIPMIIIVHVVPIFGLLGLLLYPVLGLAFLAAWIMLMVKAYNNDRLVLPVIGGIAAGMA
jgi:uncharacterized membrane protein